MENTLMVQQQGTVVFDPESMGVTRHEGYASFCGPFPRYVCKDGVSLSVQASELTYCVPRENTGPWTHVEVGFIEDANGQRMAAPDSWLEYADDSGVMSDVFGYIPVSMVADFIRQHNSE
jgi:hypothetical protein